MSKATAQPPSVPLGGLLDDKFRVRREIGRGGMAVVYEAENVDIGKRVAIKVLSAELARSKVVTERFMREAKAAAKVDSPFVCDVYDVGTFEGRPFLVMELLEGESLYARLAREKRLSVPATLQIIQEAARGLQRAHEAGIIHRDLKPENVFLVLERSGEQRTKIVDFGLARFYEPNLGGGEPARLTRAGALFGTPAYMSPEQARADVPVDSRADLWALGCITYEMLVGRTVWNVDQGVAMILAQVAGGNLPVPSRIRPDLPVGFDAWFRKSMNPAREGRFVDAMEMADALAAALRQPRSSPPRARRSLPSSADRPSSAAARAEREGQASSVEVKPNPRRSWVRAGLVLCAGAAIAGTTWLVARQRVDTPEAKVLENAPVEAAPYAVTLAEGQEHLSRGHFAAAMASFEAAFEDGNKKAARSLRSHAQAIAAFVATNSCSVSGLGHPRPFEVRTGGSSPTLTTAPGGVLAGWASQYEEGKQRTVFAAYLDPELRRVSAARPITPEALDARAPQLFIVGSGHVLLYVDALEKRSEVRVRRLGPKGPGDAVPVSSDPKAWTHSPRGAVGPDGSLWLAYSGVDEAGVHDLFLVHLDDELRSMAPPLRITRLVSDTQALRMATVSGLSAQQGQVSLALVTRRGQARRLYKADLARGEQPWLDSPEPELDEARDRIRGELSLEASADASTQPSLVCSQSHCLLAWSDQQSGAQAAFQSKGGAEVWRTAFAPEGTQPGLALREQEDGRLRAAVAWYEGRRVRFAVATEQGLGSPTVVGRVGGSQPPPVVVAGSEPGRWYIGWRNYEASLPEPFVARVDCPNPQN